MSNFFLKNSLFLNSLEKKKVDEEDIQKDSQC